MCVCVCVFVCVYMCVCVCSYLCVCVCAYMHACVHVHFCFMYNISSAFFSPVESCCLVTLKNAVKTFQNLRILDTYKEAGLTMISLSDHFGVRERLNQYIEILKVCRS